MGRPCRHDGNSECTAVPREKCPCPTCWAYYNDPRYRALWDVTPMPPLPGAVPPGEWPWLARLIAKAHGPQDIGIGDTLERHIDRFGGGAAWKNLYKRITGEDCGCENRRAKLNATYPYPP